METHTYKKFVHYEDDDFKSTVEVYERVAYLHVTVDKWSPSVLRKIYRELGNILRWCSENEIIKVYTISPNPKFCKLLVGRHVAYITHSDKEFEVFTWDLK